MKKSRCIGLLGGIGVGAASHYYSEFAKACEARGCELDLVMVHAETPRVLEYVQAGDRTGLEAYFNGFFHRMKAAGADLAVIPSVTSHFCIEELRASAPLPLAVIFEPVIQEVARRSIRRVAIFGTRFVIRSRMYGFVPELDFVEPRADEIDFIHDTYLRVALDGKGTQEQYHALRELALHLIARERLDAIIFGGTDLSLLFNQDNTDFAAIDCAALHIGAIIAAVLPPAVSE
jgi:aspartate racemase